MTDGSAATPWPLPLTSHDSVGVRTTPCRVQVPGGSIVPVVRGREEARVSARAAPCDPPHAGARGLPTLGCPDDGRSATAGQVIAPSMGGYRHSAELDALLSPKVRAAIEQARIARGGFGDAPRPAAPMG